MQQLSSTIRIGTRDSTLAIWQAKKVQRLLSEQGYTSEIIAVKSEGDLDLITPLYAMGVEGVFTRTLDANLLADKIDIAVHSMKDVPIQLAEGIQQAAVLERADNRDFLVTKDPQILSIEDINNKENWILATGSIRRRAQWLHRFPNHTIVDLRGNIATRLEKLHSNHWDGAIFAAAALERLEIQNEQVIPLNWMLPAPAQGAIMVVCKSDDTHIAQICQTINCDIAAKEVAVERTFLRTLLGGCATPIAASAKIVDDIIEFKGNVLAENGSNKVELNLQFSTSSYEQAGVLAAQEILKNGATAIIKNFTLK